MMGWMPKGVTQQRPYSRIETNKPHGMGRTQAGLFNTLLITGLTINPQLAHPGNSMKTERFQCGDLGEVTLKSSMSSPIQPSRNAYKAQLSISSKKAVFIGVIHSFMGGQDRTFTRSLSDSFRTPDETSKGNPITLSVVSGYVYGKEREQITIYTLSEANTCIRES